MNAAACYANTTSFQFWTIVDELIVPSLPQRMRALSHNPITEKRDGGGDG